MRVSLTPDKSLGYGHMFLCCGKRQLIHVDELNEGEYWCCAACEKPVIVRIGDQFYEIGKNITI